MQLPRNHSTATQPPRRHGRLLKATTRRLEKAYRRTRTEEALRNWRNQSVAQRPKFQKTMYASASINKHRDVLQFIRFQEATSNKVLDLLRTAPNKQCSIDPVPTWLAKEIGNILAPVIMNMTNKSFDQCRLPSSQKYASVRSQLKRSSLDLVSLTSFRLISNLTLISK